MVVWHRRQRGIRLPIGTQPLLIGDQYRKSVVFLYMDSMDKDTGATIKTPAASAFLIKVPVGPAENVGFTYAVTARHVIEKTRPNGPLYLRVNTTAGGFQDYLAHQDSWFSHPSTDVAVCLMSLPTPTLDHLPIPLAMLATDEYVAANNIGIGDEVFFAGLFSEHPGYERMEPIIRFGNISLMPHGGIAVQLDPTSDAKTQIKAYLIEARSWGGQSGSPAFVYYLPDREPEHLIVGNYPPALLGLVYGHYEIKQDVAFIGDITRKRDGTCKRGYGCCHSRSIHKLY